MSENISSFTFFKMSRKMKKINEKTINIKIEFSNSLVNDLNLALQLLLILNLFAA